MSTKTLPEFVLMDRLRALYAELSAPRLPYFKTLVRVFYKGGRHYEDCVVHTSPDHIRLELRGHRGSKRVEAIGNRSWVEYTAGSLYTASSTLSFAAIGDLEWALVFKIDCDLARAKTGRIDDALAHYISETAVTLQIIGARRMLEEVADRRGRPPKSNTDDMLARYAKRDRSGRWNTRDRTTAWILNHRQELDSGEFSSDEYKDPALANRLPLFERDALHKKRR